MISIIESVKEVFVFGVETGIYYYLCVICCLYPVLDNRFVQIWAPFISVSLTVIFMSKYYRLFILYGYNC
jgi:hypothetical protein